MSETILSKLLEDHQNIKDLMNKVMSMKDVVQRKDLYLQFKNDLLPHMEGEEKTLYTHLIEDVGGEEAEEVAHDAESEHEEMKNLLERLDNLGVENDLWEATFRDLRDHFLDHVAREESSLFDEAKEDFSKEELMDFGEEFEEAKLQSSL